jgi:hypothetical protein
VRASDCCCAVYRVTGWLAGCIGDRWPSQWHCPYSGGLQPLPDAMAYAGASTSRRWGVRCGQAAGAGGLHRTECCKASGRENADRGLVVVVVRKKERHALIRFCLHQIIALPLLQQHTKNTLNFNQLSTGARPYLYIATLKGTYDYNHRFASRDGMRSNSSAAAAAAAVSTSSSSSSPLSCSAAIAAAVAAISSKAGVTIRPELTAPGIR